MAEAADLEKSGKFRLDLRTIKNSQVREARLKSVKGNFMGVAYLTLRPGVWEEGDPKNRLIQLTAERYVGKRRTFQAGPDAQLSLRLGRQSDRR